MGYIKYIKLTVLLTIYALLIGCAGTQVQIFGIDINDTSKLDKPKVLIGMATSMAVHIAGHHLAGQLVGTDVNQIGFTEKISSDNNFDRRCIAAGGFTLQIGVNTLLTTFNKDSDFTKGFTYLTAGSLVTYSTHLDRGDFQIYENAGGDEKLLYSTFCTFTLYNLLRLDEE